MSTDKPNDPQNPDDDELKKLNADDLDVQELEDKLLENAAGGTEALMACTGFTCTDYFC